MEELPEEQIEAVADSSEPTHDHRAVLAEDGTLLDHIREVHHLDAPARLSPATQQGLHDRLHDTTGASDD